LGFELEGKVSGLGETALPDFLLINPTGMGNFEPAIQRDVFINTKI
jgi:hypothetical protein